jgi:peptide/nickel transport system ATP-binding protein/oligopeptide transport system ATP-binding protein
VEAPGVPYGPKGGKVVSEPILRVNNLSKHFIVTGSNIAGKTIINAVRNISFDIYEHDSFGLIGESGSGKSTTANLVLRLLEPSSGTIEIFGKDITWLDEAGMRKHRKDIQIIFQQSGNSLDPKMTVGELIMEPLKIHGIVSEKEYDKETDRLLEMVGLTPKDKSKYPSQMSGGQNQRIIIARAIAVRPRIIVCDEPVASLDVSVQGQILNLLMDLKEQLGFTYLFITHDLKVIRHICNRIAVMYNGEIVEEGEKEIVLSIPEHEYTQSLLDSSL